MRGCCKELREELLERDNQDMIGLEALHGDRAGTRMPVLGFREIKALLFVIVINSSIEQRMML